MVYADNALGDYGRAMRFDPFDANHLASIMSDIINGQVVMLETPNEGNKSSDWEKVFKFVKSAKNQE